jgi:hypothetical protein
MLNSEAGRGGMAARKARGWRLAVCVWLAAWAQAAAWPHGQGAGKLTHSREGYPWQRLERLMMLAPSILSMKK